MQYTLRCYTRGDASVVGDTELPENPTVKQIIDGVEQIMSGKDADEFCTGTDPYSGDLVRTVDGWLVVGSNGEGDTHLTHAEEVS